MSAPADEITLDLFAGPGGWSVAADALGIRELGIELDAAASVSPRASVPFPPQQ